MASSARPETLALQRLYQWEQTTPDKTVFTQPMGGGVVREWTWKQAVDEVRRMAAWLKGLNLEPGTRIALLAKNSAHWMMADWAIWMAGHVSVPLYPTLAANTVRQILDHSESKLLFVGKLDVWNDMKAGVPEGLPMITLPLAPKVDAAKSWDALIAGTANDMIFMALPLVDNFWQAQAMIMLTPRLPLYIPCVYVGFMYLSTVAVWRLDLPPLARAAWAMDSDSSSTPSRAIETLPFSSAYEPRRSATSTFGLRK